MCYRDGSVHVPLGSCPMEVIIIIITHYQQLACSTQHGLRQQIRRFNVFLLLLA